VTCYAEHVLKWLSLNRVVPRGLHRLLVEISVSSSILGGDGLRGRVIIG